MAVGRYKYMKQVKCSECGKITGGRLPRSGNHRGDGTFFFPRRHNNKEGKPCPGNIEGGIIIGYTEEDVQSSVQ